MVQQRALTNVLIDLEWAEKLNQPLGRFEPKAEMLPPELTGMMKDVGVWTPAADLWQVGLCWRSELVRPRRVKC